MIKLQFTSPSYTVSEQEENVTVCVQTDVGLPETVTVQLSTSVALGENSATGEYSIVWGKVNTCTLKALYNNHRQHVTQVSLC